MEGTKNSERLYEISSGRIGVALLPHHTMIQTYIDTLTIHTNLKRITQMRILDTNTKRSFENCKTRHFQIDTNTQHKTWCIQHTERAQKESPVFADTSDVKLPLVRSLFRPLTVIGSKSHSNTQGEQCTRTIHVLL